jgi:hypothetical protein
VNGTFQLAFQGSEQGLLQALFNQKFKLGTTPRFELWPSIQEICIEGQTFNTLNHSHMQRRIIYRNTEIHRTEKKTSGYSANQI